MDHNIKPQPPLLIVCTGEKSQLGVPAILVEYGHMSSKIKAELNRRYKLYCLIAFLWNILQMIQSMTAYNIPHFFKFCCAIKSVTALNTNFIDFVSVAHVLCT